MGLPMQRNHPEALFSISFIRKTTSVRFFARSLFMMLRTCTLTVLSHMFSSWAMILLGLPSRSSPTTFDCRAVKRPLREISKLEGNFLIESLDFFGVLLFGRSRVPPWFYLFSTAMLALGTALSAFWIMVNNSWMQVPVGYVVKNGAFVPDDWAKIILNSVVWVRFPHMILAAFLTGAFCVAATGAWYLLRNEYHAEARIMLAMGLFLGAVLVPIQIFFGHLTGDYVHGYQPAKFAAIEGRWHDEQPAGEVLLAIPDPAAETNHYEIKVPVLGSLIASMSFTPRKLA
jgi:cytochrome bd-type quinol oxidase subunit 1